MNSLINQQPSSFARFKPGLMNGVRHDIKALKTLGEDFFLSLLSKAESLLNVSWITYIKWTDGKVVADLPTIIIVPGSIPCVFTEARMLNPVTCAYEGPLRGQTRGRKKKQNGPEWA